jgi:vesicle-fusing ATPase
LFSEAEVDMKAGNDGLHVIVFDEFDSLCRKRGAGSGVSGDLNDKIVTQLLSKIDGIELLDSAILRPGRFEVHVEINLPDEKGRSEILAIHTKSLKENKCLDDNFNLKSIAEKTKNYTGAELEGLVRDARSFAINKLVDLKDLSKKINLNDIMVNQDHFDVAISNYVPAFGSGSLELDYYLPSNINENFLIVNSGFTTFSQSYEELDNYKKSFDLIEDKYLSTILISGPTKTCKTTLSILLAKNCNYPYTKVISNNDMVGYSEGEKTNYIKEVFEKAYLSSHSVIVLDDIETIIEYHRDSVTGTLRLMSSLLNTIKTLIRKKPTKNGHKLLVILNYEKMNELDKYVDYHHEISL